MDVLLEKHNKDIRKIYNGRVVDKESEDAVFFDDTHEYFYKPTGEKGISVTQLISAYEQPFDSSF